MVQMGLHNTELLSVQRLSSNASASRRLRWLVGCGAGWAGLGCCLIDRSMQAWSIRNVAALTAAT